jgi:hypothetical protein
MFNKNYKLIGILSALILLSTGLTIGFYFTVRHTVEQASVCIIEEYTNKNCFESQGQLYMDQYVKINNNRTGFIMCGPILNCLTSPCNIKTNIGDSYNCMLYSDNMYQINNYPAEYILLSVVLSVITTISYIMTIIYIINMRYEFFIVKSYEHL